MFITECIIHMVNFSRKIIKPEKNANVIITYSNAQNIQHSAR